ncbi:kinase-like domain-containing protein [Aspergillus stella-maris]|uniref:kinase-like domain-containing protein n=1 Tax=Aspergillus stella-maris TaxID=1810926 RepID=UPI003CCD1DE2
MSGPTPCESPPGESPPNPVIFYLAAHNERAHEAIRDDQNQHLVTQKDCIDVLQVSMFQFRHDDPTILATLGRGLDADIRVNHQRISRLHCRFEIDAGTKLVIFRDTSLNGNCQVHELNLDAETSYPAFPLPRTRAGKVVVMEDMNRVIGMGGLHGDLYQFKIIWPCGVERIIQDALDRQPGTQPDRPSALQQTIPNDDSATPDAEPVTLRATRSHTVRLASRPSLASHPVAEIGEGHSSSVWKAVDVYGIRFIAIKVMIRPRAHSRWSANVKREVDALIQLDHPNIVKYLGFDESIIDGSTELVIFMSLMDGNLRTLCPQVRDRDKAPTIAALHGDIKPDNILYHGRFSLDERIMPSFALCDFGSSSVTKNTTQRRGSEFFMAPELLETGEQTAKSDIWSLCVTYMWALNPWFFDGSHGPKDLRDVREVVRTYTQHEKVHPIKEMAAEDPNQRATAAQILVKEGGGQGLTSERGSVPPLP